MPSLTRRSFIRAAAASGLTAVVPSCWHSKPAAQKTFNIPGEIIGGSHQFGHLVRQAHSKSLFPEPENHTYDVAIVGGGASALCAAWKLRKSGLDDFVILELEQRPGGTSSWGEGNGTQFPWAAHYLNIPPAEADCLHEVLRDIGIIKGYDARGRPQVHDQHILNWPKERLFFEGKWSNWDVLENTTAQEQEIFLLFEDDMLTWTLYRGRDGRRAFSNPLRYSTTDTRVRRLDRISMKDYIRSKGWKSRRLDWLINYGCRDDYGATMENVSAWAGIHYFANRFYDRRLKNEYPSDTMTWPAGNGYLIQKLSTGLNETKYRLGCAVLRVRDEQDGVRVDYFNTAKGDYHSLRAKTVIYAAKLHTAPWVVADLPKPQVEAIRSCEYSPWLTAAVHVRELPVRGNESVAWDNVLFNGPSLGYIVSDHQTRQIYENAPSVLVYYLPFVHNLDKARQELLERDHQHWVNVVLKDLTEAHPNIEELVQRIDIYRWGHAMIRPKPGTIWRKESELRSESFGAIHFASCDVTGLPLFEESCFTGIRSAELALTQLGRSFETSLKGLRSGSSS